jgi:hypothetical protein
MSLQGSLREFGAPEIFQLIAHQQKTGVLEVKRASSTIEVRFKKGKVVRAHPYESSPDEALGDLLLRTGVVPEPDLARARSMQAETLEPLAKVLQAQKALTREELERTVRMLTDETIFDFFRWDDGDFRFRPETVRASVGDQEVGAEEVLFEAVRKKDEWARIESDLPNLNVVPVAAVDVETFGTSRDSIEKQLGIRAERLERMFNLADGRRSARRVIDLSGLGTFDGARVVVALFRADLIRLEAPRRAPLEKPTIRAIRQVSDTSPWVFAVGLAVTAMLWLIPAPRVDTLPVPADALSQSREARQATRIRAALEVERWVSGQYPDSLETIQERAMEPLAVVEGGRYTYERLSGGYRLFPSSR